jgi:integrase
MARTLERLTAVAVSRAKEPGYYPDGGGMYLQVTSSGAKSWVYRFMLAGKAREMGLGPLPDTNLSQARAKALEARKLRRDGIDPIEHRKAARAAASLDAAKAITFKECAARYIASHKKGWRTEKHACLWTNTLATYAESVLSALPVQSIDTGLVMRILEPIWAEKAETAGRVRQRIESILDWARVHGYRQGENPARWRGHLDKLLPAQAKVARVEHHRALPYAEAGAFMASLREQEGVGANALEFAILTAGRTGEVLGARWDEIDLNAKTWIIPAGRMKGGREHRIPLSPQAIAVVKSLKEIRSSEYVFPGGRKGRPLSNMVMLVLLRRMNRSDLTVHGFRSTFRDWAAEQTNYPREVAEMALSHAISDKVEAAYRRGDLLEKRRRLMETWASFYERDTGRSEVLRLRGHLAKS